MTAAIEQTTFADPAVQLCPFHTYRQLHEQARVYRDPVTGFYEVTGFDDLSNIALDAATFSSEHPLFGDPAENSPSAEVRRLYKEQGLRRMPTLINADDPVHRVYRGLVDVSFRPARVRALEPYIRELANMLIDRFAGRGDVDFGSEYALLLPLYVISDSIGVSRERALDFKRWSDASLGVHQPGISEEKLVELTRDIVEMQQFFADQFALARQDPKENILGDLAGSRIDGRDLTVDEAVSILGMILVAGNETTTASLGLAMRRMITTPGLEHHLRAEPSLIPNFIEESLRLEAPLQCQFRRNVCEVEIAGVVIPADSIVVLRYGGGNRDERRFSHPDEVDMGRERIRQHLSFGTGIHMCLGNLLARTELRISFELLLERLRDFRMSGESTATPNFIAYGLRSIPITFSKR
jgi:cytochrome P450